MKKTTVYLPDELKRRVERCALEQGRSEADVIRSAIDSFTADERPRPRLPLFSTLAPVDLAANDESYLDGFGED